MKEFKSVGSVCLTALIALSFLSCSTGQGGHTSAGLSISLTSDRSSILADNTTAATFTVVDNGWEYCPDDKCIFYGHSRLLYLLCGI